MLFVTLLASLLLVLLTLAVNKNLTSKIDAKILEKFNALKSQPLNVFFRSVTWLGSLWILIPILTGFTIALWYYDQRLPAFIFSGGFLVAVITTYVMKFALKRKRPHLFAEPSEIMPPDPAFPSAHTTQAFSFAMMLGVLAYTLGSPWKAQLALLFLGVAAMVALSRMYLQVHFPSDVLAGFLVALISASSVLYFISTGVLA